MQRDFDENKDEIFQEAMDILMDKQYSQNFNEKDYIEFSKNFVEEMKKEFNYRVYLVKNDEMRELYVRIIEEYQFLERAIKGLIKVAVRNDIIQLKDNFNLDNYISSTKIINKLTDVLIDKKIGEQLKQLINMRNYLVHYYFLDECKKQKELEKQLPITLFMIFEADDYIENVTNRIIGGRTQMPNIFEVDSE